MASDGEEVILSSPDMELTEITDPEVQLGNSFLRSMAAQSQRPMIKQDLRLKIQQRRTSLGLGELNVTFDLPTQHKMRPEEMMKCEQRKSRNRDSAHKSREKRKSNELRLTKEIELLEDENRKRKNYVTNLQNFEKKLRLRFADHLIRCKAAETTPENGRHP